MSTHTISEIPANKHSEWIPEEVPKKFRDIGLDALKGVILTTEILDLFQKYLAFGARERLRQLLQDEEKKPNLSDQQRDKINEKGSKANNNWVSTLNKDFLKEEDKRMDSILQKEAKEARAGSTATISLSTLQPGNRVAAFENPKYENEFPAYRSLFAVLKELDSELTRSEELALKPEHWFGTVQLKKLRNELAHPNMCQTPIAKSLKPFGGSEEKYLEYQRDILDFCAKEAEIKSRFGSCLASISNSDSRKWGKGVFKVPSSASASPAASPESGTDSPPEFPLPPLQAPASVAARG